jgi:hypothetical protein
MNIDEVIEQPMHAMSTAAHEEDQSLWETLYTEVYEEKNLQVTARRKFRHMKPERTFLLGDEV